MLNSTTLKAGASVQLDCILEEEALDRHRLAIDTEPLSKPERILEVVGAQPRYRPSKRIFNLQNPSLYSLSSTFTNSSSGSSGSNSTVTPKSFARSIPEKRKRRIERSKGATKRKELIPTNSSRSRHKQHTNFETMTESHSVSIASEEAATNVGAPSLIAEDQLRPVSIPAHEMQTRRQSWSSQERFNYDSGISMHSSSPDKDSTVPEQDCGSDSDSEDSAGRAHEPPTTAWDSGSTLLGHHPNHNAHALPDPDPIVQRLQNQEEESRQHILHSPQPLRFTRPAVTASYEPPPPWNPYASHFVNAAPVGCSYSPYARDSFPPSSEPLQEKQHDQVSSTGEPLIAGYELLASKLSEDYKTSSKDSIRPLYRRFEQLNHRVLLHLQDEISELEEELQQLDQAIAQMNLSSEKQSQGTPSRRREAQFGNELHHRRTELLGKIFVKLGQYNKAMKSYRNAFPKFPNRHIGEPSSRNIHRPQKDEIDRYRAWMERNAPIDPSEAKFLEHEGDLVALPKMITFDHPHVEGTLLSVFFTWAFLTILLPLTGISGTALLWILFFQAMALICWLLYCDHKKTASKPEQKKDMMYVCSQD